MAFLSTSDQAALQSAIDLLEKSTAVERPLSDDVIQRIAPLAESATFAAFGMSVGDVYEGLRDRPILGLIEFMATCGTTALTAAQASAIFSAVEPAFIANAYEWPVDATLIERLGKVAASTAFMTDGAFCEAMRDRPVSTLLRWGLFLGTI